MENRFNSLYLLLVYAIFLNPIIIGGYALFCYVIVYGIALTYILLKLKDLRVREARISLSTFSVIIGLIILLLASIIVPTIRGTNDYTYINTVMANIRKIIIITFLMLYTKHFYKQKMSTEIFMFYFSGATALYVMCSIIFGLFPGLKNFWINFIQPSNTELFSSYGYTFRFGWTGFSGFRNTIDCTLSLVFLVYLYFGKNSSVILKRKIFYTLIVLVLLGNFFYGRIGVIVSTICFFTALLLYRQIKPPIIICSSLIILLLLCVINNLANRLSSVNDWIIWVSTPIINFIQTGHFNNYSADRLLNDMIFMPSLKTLIIGDGYYTDPLTSKYYMYTDSGFMRQILFWGLGFTIISYATVINMLLRQKRNIVFKLLLLIIVVIFEVKGEAYFEFLPIFLLINIFDKQNNSQEIRLFG